MITSIRSKKDIDNINGVIQNISRHINLLNAGMINHNTCIILLNSIYIKPKLNGQITNAKPFYGNPNRKIQYTSFDRQKYMYCEDNFNKVVELDFGEDSLLAIGFILPHDRNTRLDLQNDQLEYYITMLKPTQITNVLIPEFKQQSKFKVDNLLKKVGMKELFTNADLSEITPSDNLCYVSDILHAVTVDIGPNRNENSDKNRIERYEVNYKKDANFVANIPFIYYVRYKPSNAIICLGEYY